MSKIRCQICDHLMVVSCKSCSNRNRIMSTETKEKIKISKIGINNPQWKGDFVGYFSLHEYVKRYKNKPEFCENCKIKAPFDLANISGKYLRDLSDWEYLCRLCHMKKDNRLNNLHNLKRSNHEMS